MPVDRICNMNNEFRSIGQHPPVMGSGRAGVARPTRKLWHPLLITVLLTTTGLLLLLNSDSRYHPRHIFGHWAGVDSGEREDPSLPGPGYRPEHGKPTSEFYQWRTSTSYELIANSTDLTQEELCRHFPKHRLSEIQPILKTGHQVTDRVRQSLQSTSACLDNILIFSDFDEKVGGHSVIDVIGDIDEQLLRSDNQTLSYFDLQEAAVNNADGAALEAVEGWKLDKFKFLPGISRAWKSAPEKSWYVFYEGDTYIAWDTVFRLLENFDADGEHYFGSPSPGRDETWFANGGPGYILSRGAMRKLVHDDWNRATGEWLGSQLSRRYWVDMLTDCCGDSVLGWVLHEHGIDLKGLWPLFNPHPLHGVPFSDLYWCQPVLSMHKSSHHDEIEFWKWEWQQRRAHRPLLWRDVATSYFDLANMTRKEDWDNAEWDTFFPSADDDPQDAHSSAEACSLACRHTESADCFQWTYHPQQCKFARSFRLGRTRVPRIDQAEQSEAQKPEEQRYLAGWNTDKIKQWMSERPCDEVQWVKPSIERIF